MINSEEAKGMAQQLYVISGQINAITQQRRELSTQIGQEEVEQEQNQERIDELVANNRALVCQLGEFRERYKSLKQTLAREIADSENAFLLLAEVSQIDQELAEQINILFTQHSTFNRKLAEEIRRHYGLSDDDELHISAKDTGASTGFVVRIENQTYYIKESLSYREDKKINPKELFLYKLIEYLHLGPKTEFILRSFSTSRTGAQICYISTRDAAHTKSEHKQKTFSLDNPDEHEAIGLLEEKMMQCEEALDDEGFRQELLALSMLEDVFYMNDSLRSNSSNYGIVRVEDNEQVRYKLKFIDHLPDRPNIDFNYRSINSAIESLQFKIRIHKERREHMRKQPPMFFTVFNRRPGGVSDYFQEAEILSAYSRLINGKFGKEGSDLLTAMRRTQEEINRLIDSFTDSFVADAKGVLAMYCEKAESHINTLQELFSSGNSIMASAYN